MPSMARFRVVVPLVVALAGSVAFAQSQRAQALTNDDVVKMVRAGLSTNIIVTTIDAADCSFDLSASGLVSLKEAGVDDRIIEVMQARARVLNAGSAADAAARSPQEKSDQLAASKDSATILRTFKTIVVDASHALYFGTPQMKAALGSNKDFAAMNLSIVDDASVADVVLEVGYTFAWDYPFSLKHQNTSVVLLAGKGSGPFSGPAGAASVAKELVKLLKPYRVASSKP